MTEEEYQEFHERMLKKYRYWDDIDNYRYDFRNCDPPVEYREHTTTQNADLCWPHPSTPGFYLYFKPDDIYTEERNVDPCPFIPKEMELPYNRKVPKHSKEENDSINYNFVKSANKYAYERLENWNFFCHIIGGALAFGGLCLIGIHFQALIVYLPASVLLILLLLPFPITRIPPLTFSKRKRKYYEIYSCYHAWNRRERKRRWRLALRNVKRYGLKKPSKLWHILEIILD